MDNITSSDIIGDQKLADVKLSSLSLSADALVSTFNSLIDSDNAKLPLSGGTVTGNLGVQGQASFVSFMQTDASDYMKDYCSRGGHLETSKGKYTDFRPLGVSFYKPSKVGGCVGAMGYCMLSGCNDPETGNGVLKLSGDATPLKEAVKQLSAKTDQFKWSIALDSGCDCYAYNVDPEKIEDVYADDGTTISATIVGLKQPIAAGTVKLFKSTEAEMLALWENQVENEDDNCFYCPTVPEAGNQLVPVFYGAHAEGCMSRAIQRATHAEGRSCLADGRYSHAEGMNTIAANAATHSEGQFTLALGGGSHAEGSYSKALAEAAHAEGAYGNASGVRSHAEGYSCTASGMGAHAEGHKCKAVGEYSHAENDGAEAVGYGSHAAGNYTQAQGKFSYVWSGTTVPNYGRSNLLSGDGIYALNPEGGINGFYIGNQTLSAIISSAIDAALKAKGL